MEQEYWQEDLLDRLQIKVQWPIIARFHDEYFPFSGFDHIRMTARALAVNEDGDYLFLHIKGEDFFGKRDHLETVGGGIEENEPVDEAMRREIREELGYECRNMGIIGSIYDAYNLIGRITFSTFFYVQLDTQNRKPLQRTEEEKLLISEVVALKEDEALKWLAGGKSPVDKLVQRRDLAALKYFIENRISG